MMDLAFYADSSIEPVGQRPSSAYSLETPRLQHMQLHLSKFDIRDPVDVRFQRMQKSDSLRYRPSADVASCHRPTDAVPGESILPSLKGGLVRRGVVRRQVVIKRRNAGVVFKLTMANVMRYVGGSRRGFWTTTLRLHGSSEPQVSCKRN